MVDQTAGVMAALTAGELVDHWVVNLAGPWVAELAVKMVHWRVDCLAVWMAVWMVV